MTHFFRARNLFFVMILLGGFAYPTGAREKAIADGTVKETHNKRKVLNMTNGAPIQKLKSIQSKVSSSMAAENSRFHLNYFPLQAFQPDSTASSTIEKESVITVRNGVLLGIGVGLMTVLVVILGNAEKSPF